jgi:hypothetical protein
LSILSQRRGYILGMERDLHYTRPEANLSLVLDTALNFDLRNRPFTAIAVVSAYPQMVRLRG